MKKMILLMTMGMYLSASADSKSEGCALLGKKPSEQRQSSNYVLSSIPKLPCWEPNRIALLSHAVRFFAYLNKGNDKIRPVQMISLSYERALWPYEIDDFFKHLIIFDGQFVTKVFCG